MVVLSACTTWKSQVFPKMHAHSAPDETSAFRFASSSALMSRLRVLPKAVTLAFFRSMSFAMAKNSSVIGLDPGHPHST